MADNFLEKRYDEVFGKAGARSAGPVKPSLDVLVRKGAGACAGLGADAFDPVYKVHQLQLEAIMATVRASSAAQGFGVSGSEGVIRVCGVDRSDPSALVRLGECLMVAKLKAVEIGLAATLEGDDIKIGKPL